MELAGDVVLKSGSGERLPDSVPGLLDLESLASVHP